MSIPTDTILLQDGCQCPGAPTIYINAAAGDSVCTRCGSVISENALVSEVTFGETSGGAAMAHGTLVAEGSSAFSFSAEAAFSNDQLSTRANRRLEKRRRGV